MKAVIAIDSFKGSLSSVMAGNAAAEGIKRVIENADIIVTPMADGGEGTADALTEALGGTTEYITAHDPLMREIQCKYSIIPDAHTAVIEIAEAAGITLLKSDERDPFSASTYGVGELIMDAVSKGCRKFIIGIGGSATNDGGIGMLEALGFSFLNENGEKVSKGAKGLMELKEISASGIPSELKECEFHIACDVNNPLCGKLGCSAVYAPQKGADGKLIEEMDKWLLNYALLTKDITGTDYMSFPGAGAAGGLGFAFKSYLGASLVPGIELVIDTLKLENKIKDTDIVITGEGCLDSQSVNGKVPVGIASIAKKYNKPVIAFSGSVKKDSSVCNRYIDAYFPILRSVCTIDEAMNPENAYSNLADTAEQVFRLLNAILR